MDLVYEEAVHEERSLYRWLTGHASEIKAKTTVIGGVPQNLICGTCNLELTGRDGRVPSLLAAIDAEREIDFAVGAATAAGEFPPVPIP